ncbi:MAG: DUF5989 family protein [Myxococcota bacterium]
MAAPTGTPSGAVMYRTPAVPANSRTQPTARLREELRDMGVHDTHRGLRYHRSMNDSKQVLANTRKWWLMPVVIGLLLTGALILLGDFRPMVERFYSVF